MASPAIFAARLYFHGTVTDYVRHDPPTDSTADLPVTLAADYDIAFIRWGSGSRQEFQHAGQPFRRRVWYPGTSYPHRVMRGGSYNFGANFLQLGLVGFYAPDQAYNNIGFRPVRTQ